jgi:hypothetical protein
MEAVDTPERQKRRHLTQRGVDVMAIRQRLASLRTRVLAPEHLEYERAPTLAQVRRTVLHVTAIPRNLEAPFHRREASMYRPRITYRFLYQDEQRYSYYAVALDGVVVARIEGAADTWSVLYKGGGVIVDSFSAATAWIRRHALAVKAGEPVTEGAHTAAPNQRCAISAW